MYSLTKFIDFKWIKPSGSYFLLNAHLTYTSFLPFAFTVLFFIGIYDFLDRKLITSEISDILHKFPFDLVIASLRVSNFPAFVEIDVLHAYWISSPSYSTTIGMTLVYPVTLYFPLMTGLWILRIVGFYKVSHLFSAFNTLSYADMIVLEYFLWYVNSDDFRFSFFLSFSPSLGITCKVSLSSGSNVGVFSFYIPGTKYYLL